MVGFNFTFMQKKLVEYGSRWTRFSNIKKYNFKVLKIEIIFACTYKIDTYSCKVSRNNTIVCDLHKNNKVSKSTTMIGFLLFEKMQIFILSFYVGHIQMYFSKI
jgi:hypothetical protein